MLQGRLGIRVDMVKLLQSFRSAGCCAAIGR
jgi:hypothetical protein